MAKKEVIIETAAEEIKDQNLESSEDSNTEEKGLEKAHPVKAFVGKIGKAVRSTPGKIVTGIILIGGTIAAIGYVATKSDSNARPIGAEAFLGIGDGSGSTDQSASDNTEN